MSDAQKPSMDFVEDLRRALATAQQGFRDYNRAAFPERPAEFFALELAGEAGEIANKEKKVWKGRDIPLEDLADEAADVVIAAVNYSNARGIDLAQAVADKLHEIERRRLRDKEKGLPL
ncbi:hypothetical protein KQI84_00560 [bacterium]|nr:hypothetical protein [bacterium]